MRRHIGDARKIHNDFGRNSIVALRAEVGEGHEAKRYQVEDVREFLRSLEILP